MNRNIPYIKEGANVYSIPTKLFENRIIMLNDEIEDELAGDIVSQLLYLDATNNKDISLYINSTGGVVTSGLAICDAIEKIKSDVRTICFGQACSMASLILSSGTRGKRSSLPNSRIMIHQPMGGCYGQSTDIKIQCTEIERIENIIYSMFSRYTGKNEKQIKKDCNRDNFMSPEEAIEYGLIDEVI